MSKASTDRSPSVRRAPPPPPPSQSNTNSPTLSAAGSRTQRTNTAPPTTNKLPSPSSLKKCTINNSNNASSPIPKRSTLNQQPKDDLDMEVPANVDEVAMINNIKEEKDHFAASQDNEALVMRYF